MNILAGALIVVSLTYIGFGIDNYYKVKVKIFYELINFVDFAKTEIAHLKTDILALIVKYDGLYPSKFSQSILKIKTPNNFQSSQLEISCLSDAEKNIIVSLIKDITKINFESQAHFFECNKNKINKYIKKIEEEKSIKGELSKKLAPLLGIGIMIILI